jgi:hypothetical protein
MTNGKRDYKKELAWEHKKKPNRVKDRAARNSARSKAGLKVGDPRHADHIKPLTEGGSTKQSNVRVISAKANLAKEARRKAQAAGSLMRMGSATKKKSK